MTREEKEVAWERINDQLRDDKMTEASKKSCFSCANWAALEDGTCRGDCRVALPQWAPQSTGSSYAVTDGGYGDNCAAHSRFGETKGAIAALKEGVCAVRYVPIRLAQISHELAKQRDALMDESHAINTFLMGLDLKTGIR